LARAPVRAPRSVSGEPFTVAHFRAWSAKLKLANGERFELEHFQELFVADVFAGVRECWLVVPEANGKTTLVALLALYHCEFRAEAWVTVAAASRDQAGLIYRQAAGFVQRNPALESAFRCHPGYRRIHFEAGRSSIQIFAADAATGDGVIPTLALIDEPHRHKNLELYRTWAGKLDKEGAQLLAISTAGEPGGEFEGLREEFRQLATEVDRDGCFVRAAGASSVLHEYAIPEDGDVEDLDLVKAANPFSGITVELLRAKRARPSWSLAHWRRFTCNLPTRSDEAAIMESEWYGQKSVEEISSGEPVDCGLDVGWKWDTTAIVPLWVRDSEFRLFGPAVVIEPPRDGTSTHPDEIKRAFVRIHERNPIRMVVMDMSNAEDIAAWLEDELGVMVVDRAQSNSFAVMDYEKFMEALRQRWLWHAGDDGLTRHALNAVARILPQGDVRFDRPHKSRLAQQERRVIDALIAGAMVHTVAVDGLNVAVFEPWAAVA
jgi:phage terminase large subunit-like protein